MVFRPCIDIHQGKVKQIVGSSLQDGSGALENYVSEYESDYYASMFKKDNLQGGHVIMLGKSPENYNAAIKALAAYPGGLQVGGGITAENAQEYVDKGASAVIVTSYIFDSSGFNDNNLTRLANACGTDRIVLDLSAVEKNGKYYIAADRWQRITDIEVNKAFLLGLSSRCSEFLVHAVNNEGKKQGVDEKLIEILSFSPIPVTYAGGIGCYEDIDLINKVGRGRVDFTVGSALDIFGGHMEYELLKKYR
ncbi:MAG: phosphoribosylformimino-5-aminoimidazole carboxamide ribotide isomerase [Clostridia bacterium]|nr:phosphoribosylformimino-5-aminoimidazole carboxamide ribotide isomerase [Clostridia bacterium]MBR3838680.1 phosphoribosylformimino-5-aminoimidazole carboxamide ribotide isomerase [Clostridia bacterium]